MKSNRTLRQLATAVALLVAFLVQGTWALAGSTGTLGGNVVDEAGKPLANAAITASAPSGAYSTRTDANGHFVFLTLAPDTYTVSVSKDGYSPASMAGTSVFADQSQNIAITMHPTLKNIATVTSRSAGNLVKSGTTSSVYSVNAATQATLSGFSGGNNLNNAYSTIYAQPGVTSFIGNMGAGQVFYIRGSNYNQVGFEFDGVPVNRAFDNYNGGSLTSLGQQELQVYTGASPAGASTATVGGYVNQVIKTGTFPGYGTANLGLGSTIFYHQAQFEAGGATPNRNFSWYGGVSGYTQEARVNDELNGADINYPQGVTFAASEFTTQYFGNGSPACAPNGLTPNPASAYAAQSGCIAFGAAGGYDYLSGLSDRESVFNVHFGLPHKNDGGKDDIQLLYTGSAINTTYAESLNDLGGVNGLAYQYGGLATCQAIGICLPNGVVGYHYEDGMQFPAGTHFGQPASTAVAVPYLFPSTNSTNRTPGSLIPMDQRNTIWNDSQIVKLQYQKNIGSNAYARIYGYSLYSDWLQNGPTYGAIDYAGFAGFCCSGAVSRDYELSAHTRGGEIQFADQVNSQNLVTLTGNYVTSHVVRFNNGSMSTSAGSTATNLTDGTNCYAFATGDLHSCLSGATEGTYGAPVGPAPPPGSPAALAGAQYEVTVPGERGTFNTVVPRFSSAALTDEIRPNDKIDLNLGVRFENFSYDLTKPGADFPFWYNAAANSYCYNLATLQPLLNPLGFGQPGPATPRVVSGDCDTVAGVTGYAHPSASDPANTRHIVYNAGAGGTLSSTVFSPRIAGTYTVDPYTVIRASWGRYAEPVTTATVQYLDKSGKSSAAFNFTNFFQYGYNTPVHPLVPQVSNNSDLSIEHQFRGTDISFKVTPFYRNTTNQLNTISIGPNFVSSLNVGTQHSYGVEVAVQKGDPSREGLSGMLSYTYVNAKVKYSNFSNGTNTVDFVNDYITEYNGLTKSGGGARCYLPGGAGPDPTCGATSITNPYYNNAPQPMLDRNGQYPSYVNEFPAEPVNLGEFPTALNPNTFAGYLSWKHGKVTIAPNFILQQGTSYGSPLDIVGLDPRACGGNQATGGVNPYTGVTFGPVPGTTNPSGANYLTCGPNNFGDGYLAIPNPQTGKFTNIGQYVNPWQFNLGLQIKYDISPKLTGTVLLANLVNRCFGGTSTPWSNEFKPNQYICQYSGNSQFYQSNFYNGSGPNDPVNGIIQPVLQQPYNAETNGQPFNAYFALQIKL